MSEIKINVIRPVSIPGSQPNTKTDLKVGVNTIDSSLLSHWYVQALVNAKVITVPKPKRASQENYKSLAQIEEIRKASITPAAQKVLEAADETKLVSGDGSEDPVCEVVPVAVAVAVKEEPKKVVVDKVASVAKGLKKRS